MNYKKCASCGIVLQSEDKNKFGYVPLEKYDLANVVCLNCYRLQHYGDDTFNQLKFEVNLSKFYDIKDNLFIISDLFHFHETINNPIVIQLVTSVNKVDFIISKFDWWSNDNINFQHMTEKVKNILEKKFGFQINVHFVSSQNQYNLKLLANKLNKNKNNYFVGLSNVGKSSLIKALIPNTKVITSRSLNTTKDFIEIVSQEFTIIDTPGLDNNMSIYQSINIKDGKFFTTLDHIKPKVYQLSEKNCLALGGIAKINFISGSKTNFVVFVSNKIRIERLRLNYNDLSNWIELSKKPNFRPNYSGNWKEVKLSTISLTDETIEQGTIIINGLAVIKFKGNVQNLSIIVPENVSIYFEKKFF
ncbi:hypothetical protein ASO20_00315 [Mycoplasma sp. (ex Biomphalaria glabrata)]|uniref:GTPase n=1 Tax=Mycoplasma sp. (ex Biomphalaria glabrata) TaxID=1749074 RepID=UPI00073A5C5C|nr:GTPase [Mycoplasma sp. (ex Biomphalaria glabrata)]ALV23125.1 hypothetical protein ASO20_00315 [Mycoplasma sp. (ex Biomphalaria glabrata)]